MHGAAGGRCAVYGVLLRNLTAQHYSKIKGWEMKLDIIRPDGRGRSLSGRIMNHWNNLRRKAVAVFFLGD